MIYHRKSLLLMNFILTLSISVFSGETKSKNVCQNFYGINRSAVVKVAIKIESNRSVKKADEYSVTKLSESEFTRFSKYTMDATYSSFLKFAIAVDEQGNLGTIYFFDTNKYPYHAQFLIDRFFPQADTNLIDKVTLHAEGRKFLLGTFLQKNNGDDFNKPAEYHVDWINDGILPAPSAIAAMKHLETSISGMNNIKLIVPRKATDEYGKQIELFKSAKISLNFSTANRNPLEVYSSNWSVGRLKVMTPVELAKALEEKTISTDDILLLDEAPRELPQVSGVIIKTPTTPSSHIALLSQMYQIPFVFDRDAGTKFAHQNGQLVFLSAEKSSDGQPQKITIQSVNPVDENIFKSLKVRQPIGSALINETEIRIAPVRSLKPEDTSAYGAKSVGLGIIQNAIPENAAETAIGLPIYYYKQFLSQAKITGSSTILDQFIQNQLEILKTASAYETSFILKSIREAIMNAVIPEAMLSSIILSIKKYFPDLPERIKFRSSSNVEDLKGFNGAGLYDSKGARLSDPESVSKALKIVWSSLFNDRAFIARKQFGVDEKSVGMGILIQKSFKGELANGVSILKIGSNNDFISEITGFPGEDLEVTAAPLGVVPETMVVQKGYSPDEPWRVELRTKSTEVSEGRTLLNEDEYRKLTQLMQKIMAAWPRNQNPKEGLDFEWKVVSENGQRKIYFKQGRPLPSKVGFSENKMVVLGGAFKMDLSPPENPEGLLVYHLPKRIHFEFNTTRLADLKQRTAVPLIQSVKFEGIQGITDLKILSVKYSLENQETGMEQKARKLVVELKLEHPLLGETTLSSEFGFTLDRKGQTIIPVINPSEQRYFIQFNTERWPKKFDLSSEFQAEYIMLDLNLITPKEASVNLSSSDGKLEFAIHEVLRVIGDGLYQKTMFKDVKNVTIKSKQLGSFSVDAKGLIYAPAHHNFSWSYVIDLNYIVGTDEQIQKIKMNLGRFIVVTKKTADEMVASFYSDQNNGVEKFKLIKEIKMKNGP